MPPSSVSAITPTITGMSTDTRAATVPRRAADSSGVRPNLSMSHELPESADPRPALDRGDPLQ